MKVPAAALIVVNDLGDTTSPCAITCTLRAAITSANSNPGADAIAFSVSGIITLTSRLPSIADDVTIDGTGQAITVSGNSLVQVMVVNNGKTLNLNALTIANGKCDICTGGGIANDGMLNVINSTFFSNTASGTGGGGIANTGMLTVTNSTFSGNNAYYLDGNGIYYGGGGIYNALTATLTVTNSTFFDNFASSGGGIANAGVLTVTNSIFSSNMATFDGGGIVNDGALNVSNSTFSDNLAYYLDGGGIFNDGQLNVTNSTFSGNSAFFGNGGDISNWDGIATLLNTIVASSQYGENCYGAIANAGHNLDRYNSCSWGTSNGSLSNTDPRLGPLADNGGSTLTMALLPGSPAINAGDDNGCPATDQRGLVRPVGPHCDIGAYEAVIRYTYLPIIVKSFSDAPDLIVDNVIASSHVVTVVIQNIGSTPVKDEFWVDLYVNPHPIPTAVNQIWDDGRSSQGVVWGVTASAFPSLVPGGMLTLTLGSAYYRSDLSHLTGIPSGTPVYVQVDSANTTTPYGGVLETHEITGWTYNNILGPVLSSAGG